jgi:hypothetical protein
VTLLAKDRLVSLAEAVGALAVENPEQGSYGTNLYLDTDDVVARISGCLGLPISPPDIDGGLLKLHTRHGLFSERDANAIYTAWLLTRLLSDCESPRICEIGGGSGRVAYWSNRLGLTSYTIIDLPRVNVVQGYYALKALAPDNVCLYGERSPQEARNVLQILPAHATDMISDPTFDLVLNQDSFPEINPQTVAEYLEWIRVCCSGRFLSINHENTQPYGDGAVQLNVRKAVEDVGGFTLEQRWPDWIRHGYCGELYRVGLRRADRALLQSS